MLVESQPTIPLADLFHYPPADWQGRQLDSWPDKPKMLKSVSIISLMSIGGVWRVGLGLYNVTDGAPKVSKPT